MPANLPPQYFEAERIYREAKTPEEKVAALEEMLAIMPKHKGTDHLRGELRAKIAKLTEASGKKATLHRSSMLVTKEGAGQIAVVGPPNSGKSQLVARVTNAPTVVADYPFTTTSAIPGMMPYENIKVQLVDLPPVVPGATEPWVASALYRADALLIVLDLSDDPLAQMGELDTVLANWRVSLGEAAEGGQPTVLVRHKRAVIAGNKVDAGRAGEKLRALQDEWGGRMPIVAISAKYGTGLDDLKKAIYRVLHIIRVYTKVPGRKPDLDEPVVLPEGSTLEDAAVAVHKSFLARLKYARVWGSGKHEGVMVKRDHVLQDGDIIELHV